MKRLSCIIIIFLFAACAYGDFKKPCARMKLWVGITTSADLFQVTEAMDLAFSTLEKNLNVCVKPTRIVQIDDEHTYTLGNWSNAGWSHWTKYWHTNVATLIITAPIDLIYFAGGSDSTCDPRRGFTVVFSDDADKYKTAFAIAHELSHLLGAKDIDISEPTLMSVNYVKIPDYSQITYASLSLEQIKKCVTRYVGRKVLVRKRSKKTA